MNKHNDYLNQISVDEALHEKITTRMEEAKTRQGVRRVRRIPRYAWAAGLAACIAALVLTVWLWHGDTGVYENGVMFADKPLFTFDPTPRFAALPPTPLQPGVNNAISLLNLIPAPLLSTQGGASAEASAAAQGANDFAFNLSAVLAGGIGDNNFVVSPYSVWMPLAALINATNEALQPALLEALGVAGISPADVNRAVSRMMFDLTGESQQQQEADCNNPLHIANAIFVDYDWTLREDFAQTFLDYFRGEVISVDFSSPYAVAEVNRWASDNTNGLIDRVVYEFCPDDTAAAVANAIYFSDNWVRSFDPERTERDVFYGPGGESYAYFMEMRWTGGQAGATRYFEDDRVQAINLPFETGGGLKIILPKDGDAVGLLQDMTAEYFNRMFDAAVSAHGRLLLPRFSINNSINGLVGVLEALGVPLFNYYEAPLTGGLLEDDCDYMVWVSNVTQVAMIDIDEKGGTAAAVTVLEVAAFLSGLVSIDPPFTMICNHPFVFALHRPTVDGERQVLFTGVVQQP